MTEIDWDAVANRAENAVATAFHAFAGRVRDSGDAMATFVAMVGFDNTEHSYDLAMKGNRHEAIGMLRALLRNLENEAAKAIDDEWPNEADD